MGKLSTSRSAQPKNRRMHLELQPRCSSSSPPEPSPGPYPYVSHEGRTQKATMEHVFGNMDSKTQEGMEAGAPWSVGWQMNERNLVWNDELKKSLIKRVASEQMSIAEEELEVRLASLHTLLPGIADRVVRASPQYVVRVISNMEGIAARLMTLRAIFTNTDLSQMINRRLALLLDDDLEVIRHTAEVLRRRFPAVQWDRLVEVHPEVLDLDSFDLAVEDFCRLMPHLDVVETLRRDPTLLVGFMKGRTLIPYDQVKNPWT